MLIQIVICSQIYLIPSAIYLCGFQEEGVDDIEDEDQDEFDPIEHLEVSAKWFLLRNLKRFFNLSYFNVYFFIQFRNIYVVESGRDASDFLRDEQPRLRHQPHSKDERTTDASEVQRLL